MKKDSILSVLEMALQYISHIELNQNGDDDCTEVRRLKLAITKRKKELGSQG